MPDYDSVGGPDGGGAPIEEWERHREVSYRRPAAGIVAGVAIVISFGVAEHLGWVAMPDAWWMDVVKAVLGIVIGGLLVVALGTGTIRDTFTANPPAAGKPPGSPSQRRGASDEAATTTAGNDEPA